MRRAAIALCALLAFAPAQAQVIWPNSGGSGTTTNTAPQYFAAANETDIDAKGNAVCALSPPGGVVNIPAGAISITKPLPICSGLKYQGVPMWGAVSSGQTVGVGGTILNGTATTITSGTYNTSTGAVVLTMASPVAYGTGTGVALASLTGTGGFVGLNTSNWCVSSATCFYVATVSNAGSTVTLTGPTGLGASTITGGSVTFDAIDYHNADLGAPLANTNTFLSGLMTGFGVSDVTFVGFANAIKIGALYNPGCSYCVFSHVNLINNVQWGTWLENYNNSEFTVVYATNNAVGQIARVGSGTNLYNGGNSKWVQTASNSVAGGLSRGIVTWTRQSSTTTQDTYDTEGPSSGSNAEVVQAATMTNLSANITVTDGTKFPIDMPVQFSASVNGFTISTMYFVVSNAGNVIQVSSTMRGSAVSATGNTAVNIKQKGFAIQEIAGLDASSQFSGIKIYGGDVEGSASTQLVLQNITQDYTADLSTIGGDTYKAITRRNTSKGAVTSFTSTTFDDDSTSYPNYDVYYDGSNIHYHLSSGATNPGIHLTNGGNFDYGISNTGRFTIGGITTAGSSTHDLLTQNNTAYGYTSLFGTNSNSNVGFAMNQGTGNGGTGNTFCAYGIVGTQTDSTYGLSTSQSGRASGDAVLNCYNGAFHQPWYVPAGTYALQVNGTATNDNASTGYVGELMSSSCPGPSTTATVTITIASPGVITWTGHGFTTACPVVFTTSGALPTGITSGTVYYVVPSSVATNTFQIATSLANALAGTSINTSGSQSGTQTGTAGAAAATTVAIGVTGLALTAGDWDCTAALTRGLGATTSVTLLKSSINTSIADGSLSAGTMSQFSIAANVMVNDHTEVVVPVRESLSATTNVFLVMNDTFTVSTNKGYGTLRCRRKR